MTIGQLGISHSLVSSRRKPIGEPASIRRLPGFGTVGTRIPEQEF